MNKQCPVCNSNDVIPHGKYRGVSSIFMSLNRERCSSCGLVFADPMPDYADIAEYNSGYFSNAHGDTSSKAELFFSALAKVRLGFIKKYIADHKINVTSVTEWGPGKGHLAMHILKSSPDIQYKVVETDVTCHQRLRQMGVTIYNSVDCEREPSDLVIISHVLEHVTDPRNFIYSCVSELKRGGVLFIEVPCSDWRHKSIDEPHLLFFDKSSLNRLIKPYGFNNVKLSYHGETIRRLESKSIWKNVWLRLRGRLIDLGLVHPFSTKRKGLEEVICKYERAIVSSYKAHIERKEPAWWLRYIGTKS